jgi:hypothetical protein
MKEQQTDGGVGGPRDTVTDKAADVLRDLIGNEEHPAGGRLDEAQREPATGSDEGRRGAAVTPERPGGSGPVAGPED